MLRKGIIGFVLLTLVVGCGGDKKDEVKEFDLSLEVARLDDEAFTLADLNEKLDRNGWIEHSGFKRIKDTAEFNLRSVDDLIIDALVKEAAKDFVIDTMFEVQKRIDEHMRLFVMKKMYKANVTDKVVVNPEDVDTAYSNNIDRYFNPAAARAAHVLVSTNPSFYIEEGQSHSSITDDSVDLLAREKMAAIIEKLDDGDSFEDLAKEYSDDQQTGQRGGELDWIDKGRSPQAFDSVLWAIELGDVSPAIKTEYGYHLIKVFERRDSSYTPLDDELYGRLEAQIRSALNKNVAVQYLDSLKALATVKYNETLLARADSTYDETAWLAVVNNVDTIFVHDYSNHARTYQMRNRLAKMEVSHKKEILGRIADLLIINVEAKKLGYYDLDEVKEELADFTRKQKEHQFRLLGELPGWEPTEDEIKAYYDENIDSFNAEKPLHIQHIVFKDSLKAEVIRKKIEDGEDFREMALKYYPGEEEIRETLFDLGYISSQEMPTSFWNAAWILDVGDVSRPVKTEYGYHLIKLLDRKPTTPFDQAKSQVRSELIEARRKAKKDAWREELLAGHSVEVDSALVREFVFQKNAGRVADLDPAPDSSATP